MYFKWSPNVFLKPARISMIWPPCTFLPPWPLFSPSVLTSLQSPQSCCPSTVQSPLHRAFVLAVLLPCFHMTGLPFGYSGLESNITFPRKCEHFLYLSNPYLATITLFYAAIVTSWTNVYLYPFISLFIHFSVSWLLSTLLFFSVSSHLKSKLHEI